MMGLMRRRFPSIQGIFDLYRPFVELAIEVTKAGGVFGQVLPDIVLLKDYQSTRDMLLARTTLLKIDWWGMAFSDAVIDAATIIGVRDSAAGDHRVTSTIREGGTSKVMSIRQADFARNPRSTFNLILSDERRTLIERLNQFPHLTEFFEVHEGVHSGNIRSELFVDDRRDESCKELLFGGNDIAPYLTRWNGRYIRLNAIPVKRIAERYANIGQQSWHESRKILVRRTGDFVLAAVDAVGRYCSNNFFLIIPRVAHLLDLYGLCALLNSRPMTAYFRLIEPRRGRVFSELKIKHLGQFPLPLATDATHAIALNDLGRRRTAIAEMSSIQVSPMENDRILREASALDRMIDAATFEALRFSAGDWDHLSDLVEVEDG